MQLDPSLFDPSLADPETVALNGQLERLSTNLPNPIEDGIEPLREARLKGQDNDRAPSHNETASKTRIYV